MESIPISPSRRSMRDRTLAILPAILMRCRSLNLRQFSKARQWVRKLFKKPARDRSLEKRVLCLNDPNGRASYCDNRINSAKYNVLTFLPLNLWEQFHRPINIYFLTIAALQFIPSVAPVSPLTTIFPITVAFMTNAVKEGVDDLRRHRQDAEVNERVYQRVKPGTLELEDVKSANIHAGDVLVLHPFEVVPSDVVILLTSHETGGAYITTESLDGETGSKQRFAVLHHVFKYTSVTTSPVVSLARLSGLGNLMAVPSVASFSPIHVSPASHPASPGCATTIAASAAASASAAAPAATGVATAKSPSASVSNSATAGGIFSSTPPPAVSQHGTPHTCCTSVEEHQLHCLRYAYSTGFVLSSEGPNSRLHSYHGAAMIRVPNPASAANWIEQQRHLGPLTGERHARDGLRPPEDGMSGTRVSPNVTVSVASAPYSPDGPNTENFSRPLPAPMAASLTFRTSAHRTPLLANNSCTSNDEYSRLLGSSSNSTGTPQAASPTSLLPITALDSLEYFDGPEQMLSVNIDNVVYASSRIGNVPFVLALVVFTGRETKMSMTRDVPKTKWASVDSLFNNLAVLIFIVQMLITAVCAIISGARLRAHGSLWYLGGNTDPIPRSEYFPILPLRYLMMLSPMVPLSFKVMVEISKAYVSCVIRWDADIKTAEGCASVNNSALAEELGQVEYVLSDKTGTLTANIMTFNALATSRDVLFSSQEDLTEPSGDDFRPLKDVGKWIKTCTAQAAWEDYYMMLTMAFCNTIERTLPTRHGGTSCPNTPMRGTRNGDGHSAFENSNSAIPTASRWMSASPDEVALVEGASQCGFPLRRRTRTHATVGLWGDVESSLDVELVHIFPFSSDRGMMSVLLRCPMQPGHLTKSSSSSSAGRGNTSQHPGSGATSSSRSSSRFGYVLLVKGADERVLPRCTDPYSQTHLENITSRLAWFSRQGLRTLVYGYRLLPEEEAKEALRRLAAVETSFAAADTRAAELQRIYELLEYDFTYSGITAVKDELQEGVAQTLGQLRHANIRVWMLTGDKTETAKQTAVACGLLTADDNVVTLTPPNEDTLTSAEHLAHVSVKLSQIYQLLAEEGTLTNTPVTQSQRLLQWCRTFFWESSGLADFVHEFTQPATCDRIRPVDHALVSQPLSLTESLYGMVSTCVIEAAASVCGVMRRLPSLYFGAAFMASAKHDPCGLKNGYCVALSGKTLRLLEAEDAVTSGQSSLVRLFQTCVLHARSVVCSRTAPSLKSYVVEMVKRSGHITLAIGDGGNDVPMLQAAHVGVGIKGLEGSQAKLASDFAIGQFRFLSKLILVHGHTAYQRTAMIVQQSFWKTVLIAWVQVLYNTSTDYSGTSYWDSLSLTLYNAIPTVPVTFLCVMDMPLSHWILRTTPQLYSMSQRGRYLNATTFYGYIARAFLHGTIVYFLSVGLQAGSGALVSNGWVLDRGGDFYASYFAAVTIHTYTVCTESHAITFAHWVCFVFSVVSCFLCFWLYARVPTSPNNTFSVLLTSPSFYLAYLGLTLAVCMSLSIYAVAKLLWFPDALQFERLLLVHLDNKAWLKRSLPMRILHVFFQDDNPSSFWKSLSPYHALKYSPAPKPCFSIDEDVDVVITPIA